MGCFVFHLSYHLHRVAEFCSDDNSNPPLRGGVVMVDSVELFL